MYVRQIKAPEELMRYIVPKGFIALDGTSLTVCEVDNRECTFTVMLVAYTQVMVGVFGSIPHGIGISGTNSLN